MQALLENAGMGIGDLVHVTYYAANVSTVCRCASINSRILASLRNVRALLAAEANTFLPIGSFRFLSRLATLSNDSAFCR